MNILFVASESAPFVKSGGLGEVIGSLPKQIKKKGADIRVILPKYGDIPEKFKNKMTTKTEFTIQLDWRNQYCGVQELQENGIHYYFIDNEFYFKRPGLYGYGDDGERFVYFNKAVLEAIPHLDFIPDIIHCHDWQSGLIPVCLKAQYADKPMYRNIKTIFTIHNLKYQGVFPKPLLKSLTDLDDSYFANDSLEFFDQANCMKGALIYSDVITTVSHTYAEEIQTSDCGEQLEGVIEKRKKDLYGILNGIDVKNYNPVTDPNVRVKYQNSLFNKRLNKERFQKQIGLPVNKDIPMIGMVSRLVEQKGYDLVAHVLDEILEMDIQLVILGTGEKKYELFFEDAAKRNSNKMVTIIKFDEVLARKIYSSSDMFLMPSLFEPCGIGQLLSYQYRAVPIVRETGGLKDTVKPYNQYSGEGTGFTFVNYNAHDMLFTIQRAVECYHNKEVWHSIINSIKKVNVSWDKPAREYISLYKQLVFVLN
ncbi:glycogen synthase GlgA [Chengkuizengella marina]|uniref:Glycogen synthase n=1 Tax=Chengkuizengella marina TaxID=2507566 RepID=A0A6N9Q046_9BACL|nr:glycogen synthase GlgA [Chengkuizengella marina]NBI28053.1 glycogen synthase GlgA [Chengkuizengella marina]